MDNCFTIKHPNMYVDLINVPMWNAGDNNVWRSQIRTGSFLLVGSKRRAHYRSYSTTMIFIESTRTQSSSSQLNFFKQLRWESSIFKNVLSEIEKTVWENSKFRSLNIFDTNFIYMKVNVTHWLLSNTIFFEVTWSGCYENCIIRCARQDIILPKDYFASFTALHLWRTIRQKPKFIFPKHGRRFFQPGNFVEHLQLLMRIFPYLRFWQFWLRQAWLKIFES
jgi:hypothetical protein